MITATSTTIADRLHAAVPECIGNCLGRDDCGVVSFWLVDAESRRHLLQEDDDRDADGEPLDDRPRDEGDVSAETGYGRDDEKHAGHHRHDEHSLRSVASNDWNEHDRHRPSWAGNLNVRAAEHRCNKPATIAVIKPASAPRPVVIPNANASGTATTPTVRPAITSDFHDDRRPA